MGQFCVLSFLAGQPVIVFLLIHQGMEPAYSKYGMSTTTPEWSVCSTAKVLAGARSRRGHKFMTHFLFLSQVLSVLLMLTALLKLLVQIGKERQ
uniref:Uncharacterized protein MANES_08G049600 n=1 Tax=Rhizophora mucronata TaxID=61149 RepID=A0A2P2Q709_RHIMU